MNMSDVAQGQICLPEEAGLGRTRPGKQVKIALQTEIERETQKADQATDLNMCTADICLLRLNCRWPKVLAIRLQKVQMEQRRLAHGRHDLEVWTEVQPVIRVWPSHFWDLIDRAAALNREYRSKRLGLRFKLP